MDDVVKIGLDFHGVINDNPKYFQKFTAAALARGWEIHVITGGPYDKVAAYLQKHHIVYNRLFAIFDFYDRKGLAEIRPDGEFKIEKQLWDSAKAEYCRKHNIRIHIDDSLDYKKSFSTPYCTYDAQNHTCRLDEQHTLDLSAPVSETLDAIAAFLSRS